jgi:hypothetical protein
VTLSHTNERADNVFAASQPRTMKRCSARNPAEKHDRIVSTSSSIRPAL